MPYRWTRELRELALECEIQPYRSSGPGGQKKNKTESSVRVIHRPTGIVRIATESRSQSANRLRALARIAEALAARRRKAKPRKPTRPTAASEERRLREKSRRARLKQDRKAVRERGE